MKLRSVLSATAMVVVSSVVAIFVMEFATQMIFPALTPSGHIRFNAGTATKPALGPKNTTLRQIKNTGDFDVTVIFNRYGLRDVNDLAQPVAVERPRSERVGEE